LHLPFEIPAAERVIVEKYIKNNRLATLHSFAKYLIFELPEYSGLLNRSLMVPFRRTEKRQMEFLTEDEFAALKSTCKTDTMLGHRAITRPFHKFFILAKEGEILDNDRN
jgi:integrase